MLRQGLMSPMVGGFSMSLHGGIKFCRRALAIKQLSAPYPSLCHVGPDSFVLWIMRELGHEFAFSGEPIEFLRGIHWRASRVALDVRAKPSRDRVFERASWWLSRRDKWIRPQRRLRGT